VRLNRFLAAADVGSRRYCDELIAAGRVTINGQSCTNFSAQPGERDHVKVDGKLVSLKRLLYIVLHKPAGFVCTRQDRHARDTIFDLLPPKFPRLFHVGRLDTQSEGLIVLTNDGAFAQRLGHPRYKIEKEYDVTLEHRWDPALTGKLVRGFFLDGQRAQMSSVRAIGPTHVRVILNQGINRQIRRMFYHVGYEVKRLVRVRIGNLRLGDLPRGDWRTMNRFEIKGFVRPEAATSIHFGAQDSEGGRIAYPAAGEKTNQDRQRRHRNRGNKKRRKRRNVTEFKNKNRQSPTR